MVKKENKAYHVANRHVLQFLKGKGGTMEQELVHAWTSKLNLNKFKTKMKHVNNDEELPVRPKSRYIFYCDVMRPIIQQELRDKGETVINNKDVTCIMGQRWKLFELNPDPVLNQKITLLAEQDSLRYKNEKESVVKTSSNHYKSPYLYFCMDKRQRNATITMKELSVQWKALKTDDEAYDAFKSKYFEAKEKIMAVSLGGAPDLDHEKVLFSV